MATRLPPEPPVLAGLTYVRPLGSGGFADVFLYEQDMPRRSVAVKVLPGDAGDPELIRMFNAEADVLARLSTHPSIVTVHQAGVSADGRPYIVMEYCPGSLARSYRRERMPLEEALAIGVKMAGALETAHRAGLVHRDIKPSNILITSFGSPVLADFGISAAIAPGSGAELQAMSVPWSAPEVVQQASTGTVASEVWSLGATVYSLLAGHSPFERMEAGQNDRDRLRRRIVRAAYPRMPRPDVPDSLQAVLARAMARDPEARFASALEFAEALRGVQSELGVPPTPLEIAVDEWAPYAQAPDFADAVPRGPARSSVPYASPRPVPARAPLAARMRDEDSAVAAAPARRPAWPWIVGGAAALTVTTAAILAATIAGSG